MGKTQAKDRIVAFVHAKGASERVPNKNLRPLGDRPLFCHAISNARASALVTDVVIDSDSDEILRIGESFGAVPLKRQKELATNATTGDELAYWQASNYPGSSIVLQVIPTSPFIRPSSIDGAIQLLLERRVDTVVGVFREPLYLWIDGKPAYFGPDDRIPNSSQLPPVIYETTGLYVNRTEFVLNQKRRISRESCAPYYLSRLESVDINYPEDFELAELLWHGLHALHEKAGETS
ncbi:MAG: acylneuraminate cytidylyltransferase family protein [Myxococcales bacterium]|nr:MAG: acylneuraminate cytidylyltransferase family protein [Myxococcales bacterium]